MSYFTTTIDFADSNQVTSAKLDQITSGLRLASESVDATTITLSSGVLSVGVLGAANLGAAIVTTVKIADANVTADKLASDSVTSTKILDGAVTVDKLASESVTYAKTETDDRATQADMQSETASHFVPPNVVKYHPGVAKAYGTVAFENGVATVTGGYNVTSASDTGSGREVTLAVTMANTNYVVFATGNGGGSQFNVTGKTTTKFTLDGPVEASGRTVSFIVFGQLA